MTEFKIKQLTDKQIADKKLIQRCHVSNLVFDDGKNRIWIVRTGEGYKGYGGKDSQILFERYNGGWKTIGRRRNLDLPEIEEE